MGSRRVSGGATHPAFAYVIEPRFSGGTSAAVAAELRVSAGLGPVVVHARSSAMFGPERRIAPVLREAIDELHLPLVWDAPQISADVVVFHNPSFLKFQRSLEACIIARQLVVVTHENFTRPGGAEAFDVAACLGQIDRATLALRKCLAPISVYNRSTVTGWLAAHPDCAGWEVLDADWFNICEACQPDAVGPPRDRRGRHSRPTREKFPPLADLDLCFSPQAEANVILGSDFLLNAEVARPHWTMLPFGAMDVGAFLEMIDFHVYFTSPAWRESFGRVIAEALAAGKVVLTDPETGATFGDAVVTCQPAEVDAVIAGFLARPEQYGEQVARAGAVLAGLSEAAFRRRLVGLLGMEVAA
ncbi:glycosyltransferase [Tropicimonas sediminicola]|uniref:Glycosyl transferases group 1 n=1 Tax=Tropicimonas sediminicola TaxID=1031541 RepID=A0A239K3K2_9RHOB|nr:hypothetical protein [Tropicimonas sediminicola]SNT12193.1 hypothetical protein SAMN05421757_106203 [Tropicimonas sediminicola]